ncbi:MAG: cation transporter, partial [Bacteroidales bacterium]|nr:cation transporter [Bacteroidales bacterium]
LSNLKEYAKKQAHLQPVSKTIHIEGMTCSGCEKTIKKAIKKLPGVMDVSASHQEGMAKVKVDSSRFNPSDYKKAIEKVGYKMLEVK